MCWRSQKLPNSAVRPGSADPDKTVQIPSPAPPGGKSRNMVRPPSPRRDNADPDDEIATDREDRGTARVGQEGRARRDGGADRGRPRGVEEERRVRGSGLRQVRRGQEARHQGAQGHQSLHGPGDDVQGRSRHERSCAPDRSKPPRWRCSKKGPEGALCFWRIGASACAARYTTACRSPAQERSCEPLSAP